VRLYDHEYLLVSMWTVSVLGTVHAGASFCVSARLCETGVLPTATGGSSASPSGQDRGQVSSGRQAKRLVENEGFKYWPRHV
jgi:hypothetical protein